MQIPSAVRILRHSPFSPLLCICEGMSSSARANTWWDFSIAMPSRFGIMEYHQYDWSYCPLCRVPKFSGVHCIDLHIPTNFGANSTKIHFIGFKGEFTEVRATFINHVDAQRQHNHFEDWDGGSEGTAVEQLDADAAL